MTREAVIIISRILLRYDCAFFGAIFLRWSTSDPPPAVLRSISRYPAFTFLHGATSTRSLLKVFLRGRTWCAETLATRRPSALACLDQQLHSTCFSLPVPSPDSAHLTAAAGRALHRFAADLTKDCAEHAWSDGGQLRHPCSAASGALRSTRRHPE